MGKRLFILGILGIIFLTSIASSFGVVTPYFDGNELKLSPGESATIEITLQNMVGGDDITLQARINDASKDIASLAYRDKEYFVAFGTEDVAVPINVQIPTTSVLGGFREIEIIFTQVSSGEGGGTVDFGIEFNAKIPVNIVSVEEGTFYSPDEDVSFGWGRMILYLIALIVIVILIIYLLKRRGRETYEAATYPPAMPSQASTMVPPSPPVTPPQTPATTQVSPQATSPTYSPGTLRYGGGALEQ